MVVTPVTMAVIPAIAIPAITADTPATEATGVDSPLIEADIRATEAAGVDSLATVADTRATEAAITADSLVIAVIAVA
ncbi:MAG: hypothetical protein IKX21_02105, partial [Deltaproteobacteria bacterium]|nr:hypothetical protein [Deltaproteobacteria bacterium]